MPRFSYDEVFTFKPGKKEIKISRDKANSEGITLEEKMKNLIASDEYREETDDVVLHIERREKKKSNSK